MLFDIHANPSGLNAFTCSFDYHKYLITWLLPAVGEVLPLFLGEFVPLAQEYLPNVKKMERLILCTG